MYVREMTSCTLEAEFLGKQYHISALISEKPLAAQRKKISFEDFSIAAIQHIKNCEFLSKGTFLWFVALAL